MVLSNFLCSLLKTLAVGSPVFGVFTFFYFLFLQGESTKTVILVLLLGFVFFATSIILTLAKICKLYRKPHAKDKPEESLWDTDLEFSNETEKEPYNTLRNPWTFLQNFFFKNPYQFCIFRPAYGMFFLTGLVFTAAMTYFLSNAEEWNDKNDYYCAGAEFIPSSMMFITLVYYISNSGKYTAVPAEDYYNPFEEYVQLPMKVLVRKTCATFIGAGGTHFVLALFVVLLILLAITACDIICELSDEVLMTVFHGFSYKPHQIMQVVLASSVVSCAILLMQMILSAFVEAKRSILGTIEKNWERNLVAIQFLLQDTEGLTLQNIRDALIIKRNGPLTEDEIRAFEYITLPIWMSKQPFGGRWHRDVPEEVPAEVPEEDIPQRGEQAVQEQPELLEQEDVGYVEEDGDTESAEEENEAARQDEVPEQESRGYELRQRRH